MKYIFSFVVSFVFLCSVSLCFATSFTKQERQILIQHYAKYFPLSFTKRIFSSPSLKKNVAIIPKNIINKEKPRNYKQFTTKWATRRSYRFLQKWRTSFIRAQKKFNVDQEVIVAIFMVETNLGRYTGRYRLLSTFSTLFVAYKEAEKHPSLYTEKRRRRIRQKGTWAQGELHSLLAIILKQKMPSSESLTGSFAGAFGIPQFLPSSYLRWGYDSDKNGTINLFLVPDSIYSTANYLMYHHWKKGLANKKLYRNHIEVIKQYNHSLVYAQTVLKLALQIHKLRVHCKHCTHS